MDQRHACTDEAPLAPGEQAAGHVHEDDFKAWFPFCQALPKAELHAHINGSVREATIMQLAAERSDDTVIQSQAHRLTQKGERSLADCFVLFDVIHRLTTRHEVVTRITTEVVADAAADGVLYLELRTTPKARSTLEAQSHVTFLFTQYAASQNNPAAIMTKRSYVDAVLKGIDGALCGPGGGDGTSVITVRLLLSIDRREDGAAAMETVELAAQLRDRGVVGIDLSGNPSVGTWSTWVPALERARELGLALTLHCGEVDNAEEVAAMLAFRPERLGHAVTAAAEEGLMPALLTSRIPVELCLTSNVLSQSVSSYGAHHFADLWSAHHPVVLCTDDSGVFDTCLSREYAIAASAFKLNRHQLWCIAQSGFEHSFAPPAVRAALLERVRVLRAGEEQVLTPLACTRAADIDTDTRCDDFQ